ncbi:MAG TPA: PA0069 family radical SAM protein [Pirellulales bacterium]|nr:PA0069 family radical SAM protein [Pirellulales bacterium]
MPPHRPHIAGRAAQQHPPNRYLPTRVEETFDDREYDEELLADGRKVPTQFLADASQSIITENNSPDVPFRWSINAYRGCEHGCAYCYARPTHEVFGLSAGLDFETKILVKHEAPALLRSELARPSWRGEAITMSGVTDCYQPAERRFCLTRGLLEVMNEASQALGIITKNALVTRDLDLLAAMAGRRLVHVFLSVTTLDAELARTMEPRTSPPAKKLAAVKALSEAGVPVGVMVAPVVPGLTDHEMPGILEAAREAGARSAGYVLLRLPLTVVPVFQAWLAENYPDKQEKVESLIRSTRGGGLYQAQFGLRQRGAGEYAVQIGRNFKVFKHKFGLDGPLPELDSSQFRPPRSAAGQMSLF